MTKEQLAPKSPWQKYGKSSFTYSPIYKHWRKTVLENGACSVEALRLACQHAKQFGMKREGCDV